MKVALLFVIAIGVAIGVAMPLRRSAPSATVASLTVGAPAATATSASAVTIQGDEDAALRW